MKNIRISNIFLKNGVLRSLTNNFLLNLDNVTIENYNYYHIEDTSTNIY